VVRGASGEQFEIRTGHKEYVVPGTVVVKSYGDYFGEYLMHG
jgi:hypothetical protein